MFLWEDGKLERWLKKSCSSLLVLFPPVLHMGSITYTNFGFSCDPAEGGGSGVKPKAAGSGLCHGHVNVKSDYLYPSIVPDFCFVYMEPWGAMLFQSNLLAFICEAAKID